jgi:hypothetical protein
LQRDDVSASAALEIFELFASDFLAREGVVTDAIMASATIGLTIVATTNRMLDFPGSMSWNFPTRIMVDFCLQFLTAPRLARVQIRRHQNSKT